MSGFNTQILGRLAALFPIFCLSGCTDSTSGPASIEVARVEVSPEIRELIDRVDSDHDQKTRLEAIAALIQLHSAASLSAMDALAIACTDRDPEIRRSALHAMASIAGENDLDCPEPLINALLDEDEDVRLTATSDMAFARYPDGAFEKLLRATDDPCAGVRSNLASTIVDAIHDDRTRSLAIEKLVLLTADPEFGVRNNSMQGLLKLKARHDLTVTYLLRYSHISFDEFDGLRDKEVHRNFSTGSQTLLKDIADSQPVLLAELIAEALSADDSNLRRNSVIETERLCEDASFKTICENSKLPEILDDLVSEKDEAVSGAAESALETLGWN